MNSIVINHFNRRKEFIEMLRERGVSDKSEIDERKYGVEVGTDHGVYAEQLLKGIPNLMLHCIDPWEAYTEGNDIKTQEDVDKIYEEAKDRLEPYSRQVLIMRQTSMQAVNIFEDDTFDFVFIDGNHSYNNVLEDITEWTKKVKPGGIVAGHDYKMDPVNGYGVIEAVEKYTRDNHVAPWFVLHAGGSFVDCYMFIKQ